MNWFNFFAQLLIATSTIPALAWLTKSFLSQQFAKDLEAYKARLVVEAKRDRVRYRKLHERRAEVIEYVYKQVVTIIAILRVQMENSHDSSKKAKMLTEEVIRTAHYFGLNALYFSEDVKKKFYRLFVEGLPGPMNMIYGLGALEELKEMIVERFGEDAEDGLKEPFLDKLKEQLPLLTELSLDLESEFKTILGVEDY